MRKRDESRLDGFKDIESLSEKLAREVGDMDDAAVDALYSEIRFPDNPAGRVQDLACTAAQHFTDNGEAVPEHVCSAMGSAAASRAVEIAELIEPQETPSVPVRELVAYRKQRALASGLLEIASEEQSQVAANAVARALRYRARLLRQQIHALRNALDRKRASEPWLAAKLNPKDWSLGLEIRPPTSPGEELVLRDRGFRLVLIPAVGVAIAYISGFFDPYRPGSALFWAGLLWAIFMSFVLWHANRRSFRIQRQRYDGFQHRFRKMCMLLLINLFLTVPLTWLMLKMWYFLTGLGPDLTGLGPDLTRILITTLFGVAVITHRYDVCFWRACGHAS
jgi:hypothetical protein